MSDCAVVPLLLRLWPVKNAHIRPDYRVDTELGKVAMRYSMCDMSELMHRSQQGRPKGTTAVAIISPLGSP